MKDGGEFEAVHPDVALSVGGSAIKVAHIPTDAKTIEVREFTFGEELKLELLAAPIIEAIAEIVNRNPGAIYWNQLMAAAGEYPHAFRTMLAVATGLPENQIDGLKAHDGRRLVAAFFQVNWGFFRDRLVIRSGSRERATAWLPQ